MKPRVVSLLPSTSEIVCALGQRDLLVGRSHECDYPASVSSLPVCTRARLEDGSSREIDDRVKELVELGTSIYDVDAEQMRALRPDVVLTQDQCEVCAASLSDVERALGDWTGHRPEIISLSPRILADVWSDIARVADALGTPESGRRLLDDMDRRVADIGERSAALASRPRVACLEWIDPLMGAGNWMPELVALARGEALFGQAGEHSQWLEWSELVDRDPDVIVLTACGFDMERTRTEASALQRLPGYRELRAVREGRIFAADGNAYFNRPGPRLIESLEILAELVHPGVFDARHASVGWAPLG